MLGKLTTVKNMFSKRQRAFVSSEFILKYVFMISHLAYYSHNSSYTLTLQVTLKSRQVKHRNDELCFSACIIKHWEFIVAVKRVSSGQALWSVKSIH
jgi:hypothetical protein